MNLLSHPEFESQSLYVNPCIKSRSSKSLVSIRQILTTIVVNSRLSYPLFRRRAQIIVASNIVAPPLRERFRCSSSAEDSERHDEQRAQAGTVECAHDHVSVLPEEARLVVAQVELREETGDDPGQDDASLRLVVGDVARVLDELRQVHSRNGDATNTRLELKGSVS